MIFITVVIVVAGEVAVGRALEVSPELVWAGVLGVVPGAGLGTLVYLSMWLEARRTLRELGELPRRGHRGRRANGRRAGRGAGPGALG